VKALDWGVVVLYLAGTLALGLWVARRGASSLTEFFVGGRAIPWWLAATSMAATTFNVDTPLYVAGRVARDGVAGNWEWWSFALMHVLVAVVLAKLWRRARVLTDMEFTELRYGGPPAAGLRAFRSFITAVPLNCISIGYGMLAMRKVVIALGVLDGLPNLPGDERLWAILPILVIVVTYTAAAGLWGVVATDFLQYILAMAGAFLVMFYALHEVGGLSGLTASLRATGQGDKLALLPTSKDATLPLSTFAGYCSSSGGPSGTATAAGCTSSGSLPPPTSGRPPAPRTSSTSSTTWCAPGPGCWWGSRRSWCSRTWPTRSWPTRS